MAAKPIAVGMTPPHPGEFVREDILEPLGLSVAAAARILGVRRATLSDLLNEKARLSPKMALRLEKAFDTPMDQMLRLQAWYDTAQMRKKAHAIPVRRYEPA